ESATRSLPQRLTSSYQKSLKTRSFYSLGRLNVLLSPLANFDRSLEIVKRVGGAAQCFLFHRRRTCLDGSSNARPDDLVAKITGKSPESSTRTRASPHKEKAPKRVATAGRSNAPSNRIISQETDRSDRASPAACQEGRAA